MRWGLRRSAKRLAVVLGAELLTAGIVLNLAAAADVGGNCCGDLEERVAELEATTARKSNRKVSLTISGQVSTALMVWDDGKRSDAYVVDNTVSRTGFQFDGSAKINPNLTAGFQLVLGISGGARSSMVNQKDDDATVNTKLTTGDREEAEAVIAVELAKWYIDHKHLGRVAIGRINTASDDSVTVDLGGADVIATANIGQWQRGMFLTLGDKQLAGTWSAALGGTTVNEAGLSRDNAISYTTPTAAGFSASVAWSESDLWDAALRFAGEHSGLRVAAAIAYLSNHSDQDGGADGAPRATTRQGSGSIMHVATGLYLTGAFVNQNNDAAGVPDTTLWYVQGGISRNWTGLGRTVLYAEHARVNDGIICGAGACKDFGGNLNDAVTSSQANVWGLGAVQHIDAAAMEVFLAYRRYTAEVTSPAANDLSGTVSFNGFDVIMSGARIRF